MLASTKTKQVYDITGITTPISTGYEIPFRIFSADYIKVAIDTASESTEISDVFTVTENDDGTGLLTFSTDYTFPDGALTLTIYRGVSIVQNLDLRNGDRVDAETLEEALDLITAIAQQLSENLARAITIPVSEDDSMTIPPLESRAGMLLGFDTEGNIIGVLTTDIEQKLSDALKAEENVITLEASAKKSATAAADSESTAKKWAIQDTDPVATETIDGVVVSYYSAKHYAEAAAASAEAAAKSEENASNSATAAAKSADAAASSESNAKDSETAAGKSATNAANSETAAGKSATAASQSESNAKNSETAAGKSATAASESEANAKEWASSSEAVDTTDPDNPVYSAKHYAEKTAEISEQFASALNRIVGVSTIIGDGSTLVYTIEHNLAVDNITVDIWCTDSSNLPHYTLTKTSNNILTITFDEAPPADSVKVYIHGAKSE